MSAKSQLSHRIKRLDNRLANQIAAGEVVERPASVVKELLENSIDAGASRIEVDIERGGTRLIRITDNGCGIVKDDLNLALSRHATSKIYNSSDLASINSLGFRGEALASIGSVSRLCLTSRTDESDFAWQAIAEGRDMNVDIQPASATVGTRIEVRDLFYNTPARQKFLRAEKTEFGHIEEIFKRHALVNFETAFILKHNHKVVKRVPASSDASHEIKRIESICGKPFADNSIHFNCQHDALSIKGWLGKPSFHRSESDIQYVFINGRPVKDKMLNHAIRQSYQGLLPPGRMPTFVIFLQIDPTKIDVNVHPTKHEVRFDEQRLVHDLLVKSISDALSDEQCLLGDVEASAAIVLNEQSEKTNTQNYSYEPSVRNRSVGVAYSQISYFTKPKGYSNRQLPKDHFNDTEACSGQTDNSNLTNNSNLKNNNKVNLKNGLSIVFYNQQAYVLNEFKILKKYINELISGKIESQSKPLLFPKKLLVDLEHIEEVETIAQLNRCGFIFEPNNESSILLKQLPVWLDNIDKEEVFSLFLLMVEVLASERTLDEKLETITEQLKNVSHDLVNVLFEQQLTENENCDTIKLITADMLKVCFNEN